MADALSLFVRRLEARDIPARVQWLNTPSTCAQMTVDAPLSVADTEQWFKQGLLNDRRRDFVFTRSIDPGDDPIAMGGLIDIDQRHRHSELYVFVAPALTAQGIGRRVVQWLCGYGFRQLSLWRVYLHTLASNDRARRLYERLGFAPEGVLRQHVSHDGRMVDRHVHGLLRTEWRDDGWRVDRAS